MINNRKLVIVLIGLPARGKSYVSKKLTNYLNWLDIPSKIFNVGNYRRLFEGKYTGNNFFDNTNNTAQIIRLKSAEAAMNDMINWLMGQNGEIAFFDATNTTRDRRQWIKDSLKGHDIDILFFEILCDDEETINDNIKNVKLFTADYENCDPNQAIEDFKTRISHYESVYEPIDLVYDQTVSFIKMFNKGERFETNLLDSVYKIEVFRFIKSICLKSRTLTIITDMPKPVLETMKRKDENLIHFEINDQNQLKINGKIFNNKESQFFADLPSIKENTDCLKFQLIPFILETEKHDKLTIVCDERISRLLLKYFNRDFVNKDVSSNSFPGMLRIDCNHNNPAYSVYVIM